MHRKLACSFSPDRTREISISVSEFRLCLCCAPENVSTLLISTLYFVLTSTSRGKSSDSSTWTMHLSPPDPSARDETVACLFTTVQLTLANSCCGKGGSLFSLFLPMIVRIVPIHWSSSRCTLSR